MERLTQSMLTARSAKVGLSRRANDSATPRQARLLKRLLGRTQATRQRRQPSLPHNSKGSLMDFDWNTDTMPAEYFKAEAAALNDVAWDSRCQDGHAELRWRAKPGQRIVAVEVRLAPDGRIERVLPVLESE